LVLRCMVGRQLPPQVDSALGPQESDPYDYASIEISDTGAGMSEAIRDRAFEPFFTTKQPGRGTGLGLSTVYGFVKQSKGAIELDSKVGVGTTVTLFLPRHRDERPRPEAQDVAAGKIPPGLRVLLVEDEPAVRTIVKAFLGTLGCDVTACVSAEQALETVKSLAPLTRFDLLLTDIALGDGMRGTELARRLRSKFPSMISLLMSGFSSDMLEAETSRPGALHLLLKPFSRQDLAHAIAKALGSTQ
jgi:CheY-like chemotaxis protein